MNPWSIIASVAMLAAAGLMAWRHVPEGPDGDADEVVPPSSAADRIAAKTLHFFGIGGISLPLAGAVILGVAAVVAAALDIIAVLHLGRAYPAWFPLNATLLGLAVGLGCARLVADAPDHTS